MRQQLTQKLSQKLLPQQILLMKLLEIPSAELEKRIKEEIEQNPALEEFENHQQTNDDFENSNDTDEATKETDDLNIYEAENENQFDNFEQDEMPNYKLQLENDQKQTQIFSPAYEENNFREELHKQVHFLNLNEFDFSLIDFLIDSLDEDGYLRRNINDLCDDFLLDQNQKVATQTLEKSIQILQSLDPAGIAAKDLQECLLLQLKRKKITDKNVAISIQLIDEYFEEFSKKHYEKISKQLKISQEQLKNCILTIQKLNPKPASFFNQNTVLPNILPDFILSKQDDTLSVQLVNYKLPPIKINPEFKSIQALYQKKMKNEKEIDDAKEFVNDKIDKANIFINALTQREKTLLSCIQTIVNYQHKYFQQGEIHLLKPMGLKVIAEKTGLDISTISRVVNSKYIQTHFGLFSLKSFFSEAIENSEGELISNQEVKNALLEILLQEDKRNPINDDELVKKLSEKNYTIARRTVAKYREKLGFNVARLRKSIE